MIKESATCRDRILTTTNNGFNNTVLSSFHNDDVGMLCRTDSMITVVGKILWERSVRQEKRTTMGEMRKLGILLKAAKDISE